MITFRDKLIKYLEDARDICDKEIEHHKNLQDEEKEQAGLMIRHASLDMPIGVTASKEFRFRFDDNRTKIRLGDKVKLTCEETNERVSNTFFVLEVNPKYIVLRTEHETTFDENSKWSIEVVEISMFGTFISVLKSIDEGMPGSFLIKEFAGEEKPLSDSLFGVKERLIQATEPLRTVFKNESSFNALFNVVKQPSLRLIQGPPGTGKTFLLSHIAKIMATEGLEVAIVAKTHQAVNNALNAVRMRSEELTVCKIGQEMRSEGLDESILNFDTFNSYLHFHDQKRHKTADVVGMTLQAFSVNLSMRNTGFKPEIVLVDEASQIPLAEAAVIGASGAGSVIFIGDDRQMPPIFLEELEKDSLSVSIFEYVAKLYPNIKDVLNVTHRMNDEICAFVSKHYYEPYGIELVSSESAAGQRMVLDCSDEADERMEEIFGEGAPSIIKMLANDPADDIKCKDENVDEGLFAAQIASVAMKHGVAHEDIAIVTPFRKQVNTIRTAFKYLRIPEDERPLVDTVERLQGQDVRLIILSFAVSDPEYYSTVKSFLLNPNRLNVMISRAKEKVVIIKSSHINF